MSDEDKDVDIESDVSLTYFYFDLHLFLLYVPKSQSMNTLIVYGIRAIIETTIETQTP